jgi:hypothetical protein
MKPYIQTIIAIVVGANTIFGKFFSRKLNIKIYFIIKNKNGAPKLGAPGYLDVQSIMQRRSTY